MTTQEKIIDKIDSILDWEIKDVEFGCILSNDWSQYYVWYEWRIYQMYWDGFECEEYDEHKYKIIWKPISKALFEKALLLTIKEIPSKLNDNWNYNLPDDLIEQCKDNKYLENYVVDVFNIN